MNDNDCGGTDWVKVYNAEAQQAMRNNPGAIVTDKMGNVVKPLADYWPNIKGWYKRRLRGQ